LGRQMFRTPVCNRTRHLDFPPKPCSNSIFKPQPGRLRAPADIEVEAVTEREIVTSGL